MKLLTSSIGMLFRTSFIFSDEAVAPIVSKYLIAYSFLRWFVNAMHTIEGMG